MGKFLCYKLCLILSVKTLKGYVKQSVVSKKAALLKKNWSVKRVHIETPWTDLSTIDLIGVTSPGKRWKFVILK